ncbi:hypothetical protein [Streptomyces sp. NPDC059949]|uniref:hypothetical protein n=1 Tax=Streptomyces sp. NPDC059949 TaxID=3347013 RepID=UPI003667D45A
MSTRPVDPLYNPQNPGWTPSFDVALDAAREVLAEQQAANIYDDRAMLTAAVRLEIALRHLLAAYDAKAGQ